MRACVMVLVLVDVCMLQLLLSYFVIVFKQRTAYEKRMSDWRSDVCSSDLLVRGVDTVDIKAWVGFGKAKPLRLFQHLVKGTPFLLHGGPVVIAGAVQNAVDDADLVCSRAFAQPFYDRNQIGRAHVLTPVTNAQLVFCLLLPKKKKYND